MSDIQSLKQELLRIVAQPVPDGDITESVFDLVTRLCGPRVRTVATTALVASALAEYIDKQGGS